MEGLPRVETPEERTTAGASPFMFVANALALDLVNTELVVRGRRRDLLATPDAVVAWWAEARARYLDMEGVGAVVGAGDRWRDAEAIAALKGLRAAVRMVFAAVAAGGQPAARDLEPLNRILRTGYHVLDSAPTGAIVPAYGVRDAGPDGLLLPLALSAFRLLTEADPARLRSCEYERCIGLFYDTSKSATRRWCGEGCMNRARSAQRYAQTKAMRHPGSAQ